MEKLIKNKVFIVILLLIIGISSGVGATLIYNSNQISYTPADSTWNVTDVKGALDDLYIAYDNYSNIEVLPITFYCANNGTTTYSKTFNLNSSKTYLLQFSFGNYLNSITAPYVKQTDGEVTTTTYNDIYGLERGEWYIIKKATYISVYGVASVTNEGMIISGVYY